MKIEAKLSEVSRIVNETVAAHAAWEYYKKNKSLLAPNIREHCGYIIEQLIQGLSTEQAFSQFVKVSEPILAKSKADMNVKAPNAGKQARAPWPFIVQSFANTDKSNVQPAASIAITSKCRAKA
jgi:hypothetical protein